MRIIECAQGSPEWWTVKAGIPSASNFDRIFAAASRRTSKSQDAYIAELIADLKDPTAPYFTNRGRPVNTAIENGIQLEPEARKWLAFERGYRIQEAGFCLHDSGLFGCSPDGLIGDEGGAEIKCPMQHTHAKYVKDDKVPTGYLCQVHGCLLVSNRQWWDFMSYAEHEQPLIVRVVPDDFTLALAEELYRFVERYKKALADAGLAYPTPR